MQMKRFNSPSDFSTPSNVGQSRRSSLASQGAFFIHRQQQKTEINITESAVFYVVPGFDRPRGIQTSFRPTSSSETDDKSTTPKKTKRRRYRAASSSSSLTPSKRSSRWRAPYVASLEDDHEAHDQLRGV